MSGRIGTRRLLIVLSGLYWIGAIIGSIAVWFHEQDRMMAILDPVSLPFDEARFMGAFKLARSQGQALGALALAYFAVGFALLWGGYFTVRWVIRGYQKPPTA